MSRKPTKSREWHIMVVRAKGQYLGRVQAPDEATAIREAIRLFNVPQVQWSRLVAQEAE
jgi:hypothetical protein